MGQVKTRWYKDAVVYQIYPRSFCDSNGDGIGDLRGIISKLDYLKELGVTAVWLSPIYKSPNDDNGYDISDYRDIMDEFGTLEDFKELVKGLHDRGIKLVMDLVANHTSDEHEWFKQSRSSKDNPYRDYYIWRKGKGKNGKKPPNNWTSRFTGSAWEYDETTGEYYLHLFSKKQPDLNWDNPKVRKEIIDICNYWFEMGVDGFRCDVITFISKEPGLPDGKWNPVVVGDEHFVIGPRYHEYIHEVCTESWNKYDSMTVGEGQGITIHNAEEMVGEEREELDTIFTFEHQDADFYMHAIPRKFSLKKWKSVFSSWQKLPQNCWPTLFYENHDQPRAIPRYGKMEYRNEVAKMLAISIYFQKGTPYLYQGQEIGMTNFKLDPKDYKDIISTRVYNSAKKFFGPLGAAIAKWGLNKRARDLGRTPMQWTAGEYAGFSTVEPWMTINPNYKMINVEDSKKDENSVFNFYKKLIKFRLGNKIIIEGSYKDLMEKSSKIFAYERALGDERYVVISNYTDKVVKYKVPEEYKGKESKLIMSNYSSSSDTLKDGKLLPYEAVVYYVKG